MLLVTPLFVPTVVFYGLRIFQNDVKRRREVVTFVEGFDLQGMHRN